MFYDSVCQLSKIANSYGRQNRVPGYRKVCHFYGMYQSGSSLVMFGLYKVNELKVHFISCHFAKCTE